MPKSSVMWNAGVKQIVTITANINAAPSSVSHKGRAPEMRAPAGQAPHAGTAPRKSSSK